MSQNNSFLSKKHQSYFIFGSPTKDIDDEIFFLNS
jgi:hypothetical protein